jgi:hypothetical protein
MVDVLEHGFPNRFEFLIVNILKMRLNEYTEKTQSLLTSRTSSAPREELFEVGQLNTCLGRDEGVFVMLYVTAEQHRVEVPF